MQKNFKYILPIFIFLTLIISGCSEASDTPNAQIPTKFESDFDANFENLELSGHISRLETGIYTFTFTAPKSLEGIELKFIGDTITALFNGVDFEANVEAVPYSGFIKSVANSLDTISKSSDISITKTDGYNKYSAKSQLGTFYILQEQDSADIVSLVIESTDTSIKFSNFST